MNNEDNSSSLSYEESNQNEGMSAVLPRQAAGPTAASQAVQSTSFLIDPLVLFRHTSVITVIGRIEDWTLEWAGRIRCTLCLSIGDMPLTANRDTLPLEIENGCWVRARVLLRRGSSGSPMRLLGVTVVQLEQIAPTSWTPTVLFHRYEHMRRLRLLLSKLEPGLQAIFMAVMVNAQVQHRFFFRMAASDHHTYPGGLFDHSIEAAEMVHRQKHLSRRERGLAALACLLFDLGKVSDEEYRADRHRCTSRLEPHANTARHIGRALDSVERFEPDLVESLRMLLVKNDSTEWPSQPGLTPTPKQCVHQALQQSWQFDKPINDDSTKMSSDKMNFDFNLDLADVPSDTSVLDATDTAHPASLPAAQTKAGRRRRVNPTFSLEWAAGFADGEGCICIVKQRYADPKRNLTYRLAFSIVQNDLQVLEHFYKGLGIPGGIFDVGRIVQHNRQVYTLNYTGVNALKVIAMLQPHLIRKRLEAQTAIDYWSQGLCGRHPGRLGWSAAVVAIRERFYQKMKSLK